MSADTNVLVAGPVAVQTAENAVTTTAAGLHHHTPVGFQVKGTASDVSRQLQKLNAKVSTNFWTGHKGLDARFRDSVLAEFPTARLVDSTGSPLRTSETTGQLGDLFKEAIQSDCTLVAPFAPEADFFVQALLTAARRSILLHTPEELQDPPLAFQRMQLADLSILNDHESFLLTRQDDPVQAIRSMREQGAKGILVTYPQGVLGFFDGNWICCPSYRVRAIKNTAGAGDTLAAVVAFGFASGWSLRDILPLALVASARHVEGSVPAQSLDELESDRRQRPPMSHAAFYTPHLSTFQRLRPYLTPSVIGAAAAAALAAIRDWGR